MTRYVIERIAHAVLIMAAVSVIVFLLVRLVPGDPGRIVLGPRASDAAVNALDERLGLNDSLPTQFLGYVKDLAHADFGESFTQGARVSELIGPRVSVTALLLAYSLVVALVVAVPLAVLAAVRQNRPTDHFIRIASVVTYSMPPFWFGLLLVLIFSLRLNIFSASGYIRTPLGVVESLTLPAITTALFTGPVLLRTLRSSVIENLGADFVEAARARGLSRRRVVFRHVLRNALLSSVTLLGVSVALLLSVSVVVEQVFALPGLGSLLVESVGKRDFPTVQALTLIFAATVVVATLVTDLLYVVIDPRIRVK